ncbi:MAG: galactokinase [Armatimonadota bacterium]
MPVSLSEARARLKATEASALCFGVIDCLERVYPDCGKVSLVRAPGRVNIIGEHTDYNGLPVMPMAIDREIVIAFGPGTDSEVDLVSVDPSYPRIRFAMSGDIAKYDTGHWGNYVKAAAQAIWRWAETNRPDALPLSGIRGCVAGSVPPGSGLSSSSALVVAAALAVGAELRIDKLELAELLAKAEHYVGTEGGGMDQAVSLMAERGSALKIDFFPLRTKPVKLPAEHVIVVANSMVSANKTGAARMAYNTRVAECRLGLEMLAHLSGLRDARLLRDIMYAEPRWRELLEGLPDDPMSIEQVSGFVGTSTDDIRRKCLTARDGSLIPEPYGGFQPKKRCRHVLTEAARVELAAEAAERGDACSLGKLMDESHTSCAEDYEISRSELDTLVSIMRRHGALGARLTGAGFGGCAIALVTTAGSAELMDALWADYYLGYLRSRGIESPQDRESVLFACSPAAGAHRLLE